MITNSKHCLWVYYTSIWIQLVIKTTIEINLGVSKIVLKKETFIIWVFHKLILNNGVCGKILVKLYSHSTIVDRCDKITKLIKDFNLHNKTAEKLLKILLW